MIMIIRTLGLVLMQSAKLIQLAAVLWMATRPRKFA